MAEQTKLPTSLVAAAYESLIGAIYLDGGLEPARAFILEDMSEHMDAAAESENQRNYKSHLQQYAHRQAGPEHVQV